MKEIILPNWYEAFEYVCKRGEKSLEWGLPEQWVHAELFSAFKAASGKTGWVPFRTEIPYFTYYPVTLPKSTTRDWKKEGGIKFVDICLSHSSSKSWCWFELKVRRGGDSVKTKNARDAFAKDYVALCGLAIDRTAKTWKEPDEFTKAGWMEDELKPKAKELSEGTHYFISAYLQLDHNVDHTIFPENEIRNKIESWFQWRSRESCSKRPLPKTEIQFASQLPGGHSLVICQSEPVKRST